MTTVIDIHSGLEPGLDGLLIRPAVAADIDGVRRLHLRSSAASRQRRYLSGLRMPPDAKLRRLLEPAGGVTLLAVQPGTAGDGTAGDGSGGAEEQVVAMANLLVEGILGEVALLVEDAWQRRGIGTLLLRELIAYAKGCGFAGLIAHTGADNVAMLRVLRRLGAVLADRDGPMVSMTVPVSAR